MPTFVGLVTASINFFLVELRPMILVYSALETVSLTVVKDQYTYRLGQANETGTCTCPGPKTSAQFDSLLSQSLYTYSLDYEGVGECCEVKFDGTNYAAFVHGVLLLLLGLMLLINTVMYFAAAFKGGDTFTWDGGEYIYFTLKREHLSYFNVTLNIFIVATILASLSTVVFIIISSQKYGVSTVQALWIFVKNNFVGIALAIWGISKLAETPDNGRLDSWNTAKFKQLKFKRSFMNMCKGSSDSIYMGLCTAKDENLADMFPDTDMKNLFEEAKSTGSDESTKLLAQE